MPSLQAIADLLNDLLTTELASDFAPAVVSSPHAGRTGGGLRKSIHYIADADARRARDLWSLLQSLGLESGPKHRRCEPLEAYLSMSHTLPRLIRQKERTLQAYRDAVAAIGDTPESVAAMLRRHLTEHAGELEVLRQTAEV